MRRSKHFLRRSYLKKIKKKLRKNYSKIPGRQFINAAEIAASTAIITAGFLCSRFLFLLKRRRLLLEKGEALDVYTLKLANLTHSVESVATTVTILSAAIAFALALQKPSLDKLKEKLKSYKANILVKSFVVIILYVPTIISLIFWVELDKYNPDIKIYILPTIIFVLASAMIVRGKLTTLAFFSAFYLFFCALFTFIDLINIKQ